MNQGNPPAAIPAVDSRAAPQPPFVPDRLTLLQHAYLLEQLAADGAARKSADLNRKIPKGAQRELKLTAKVANAVRSALAEQDYLRVTRAGQSLHYEITEAGRAYLAGLERPSLPGRAKPTPVVDEATISDEIREAQNAFLLLQLINAEDQTLNKGDANRIRKTLERSLALKPAMANYRRAKLVERGYIRMTRVGRSEAYSLTPDGLEYLAAGARHLGHVDFTVKGKALNVLVAAARESPFHGSRPGSEAKLAPPVPERAVMESAVLAEFGELCRERHSGSGLVPIYEVRQRIVERFGSSAGRHDVLDEVIIGLWRQQRLGLEGISDLGKATTEQLNGGIPGVSGTLFYLEAPREQPVGS